MDATSLPLWAFLQSAQSGSTAALNLHRKALQRCAELDAFMGSAATSGAKEALVGVLRLAARGLYCASIHTALLGYHAALFPTLRASLESVCYAQEISLRPELGKIWLQRHDSEESKKAARKAFNDAVSKTSKRFGQAMQHNEGMVMRAYDVMIDHGAHPNVRSIVSALRHRDTATHHEVALGMVVPSAVEWCLFCCFEMGLFTSWMMTDFDTPDTQFWAEASRLNDMKDEWEQELESA